MDIMDSKLKCVFVMPNSPEMNNAGGLSEEQSFFHFECVFFHEANIINFCRICFVISSV
jgi:hypothetical protein